MGLGAAPCHTPAGRGPSGEMPAEERAAQRRGSGDRVHDQVPAGSARCPRRLYSSCALARRSRQGPAGAALRGGPS